MNSNSKMYIGLYINCPIFLPDFNQIWVFLTDFHGSVQHQIHRNLSSGSHNDTYGRQDEANNHISQICKRA